MSENKINPINIPIETQHRMSSFFLKTSAPRLYKKHLEEQKRKEMESQQNENKDKE